MFKNLYKNKKVLITGHTGFKGSWLSIWLLKLGAKVYGISKDIPTDPSMFKNLQLKDQINNYKTDIKNLNKIKTIINDVKPDFVFHLAAQPLVSLSYSNPINTITTNVIGTSNILEALRHLQKKCACVIITSDKCYDNAEWVWGYKETDLLGGKDIYSGSKAAAEILFKSFYQSFYKENHKNISISTARAGNVIGGGDWAKDRIVPDAIKSWSKNKVVNIRSPEATRPWQHVLEPLSGYLLLGKKLFSEKKFKGESYNFGPNPNNNFNVETIIRDLSKYWDFKSESDAYKVIKNKKFHEAGLLKLNCDKAYNDLKWKPVLSYDELIEFTSKWYYNFYKSRKNMFDFTHNQISFYENKAKKLKLSWAKIL